MAINDTRESVQRIVDELFAQGILTTRVEVTLERPKSRDHGDYATNVALVAAKNSSLPPRELANQIAERLSADPAFTDVSVAGPGFVNIRLSAQTQGGIAERVVHLGSGYGRNDALLGKSFNVEFISANPTGPLHLGHTRWAAVGDALARVLAAAGADVTTEFYINDRGVQMDKFGISVMAAASGEAVPEDGYHGGYILDLAAQINREHPEFRQLPAEEQMVAFREEAYALQWQQQKDVLELFRTHFDVWYSERKLYDSGAVERAQARLEAQGHVFESEGALWLRTTTFGDDKDRVLIKENGERTYFAADTAYYVDKRMRGFDTAIYLLGADHHGYVNRLRAVAACAGDNMHENIEILIGQLVKITRGGVEVKLSKRSGQIVTLEELVEEVGVDAARYTLARYPVETPLVVDLEEIARKANDNPVFYVQYAHARISSVLRNAQDIGAKWRESAFIPELLDMEQENELLGVIEKFPAVIAAAAELREPHRVARFLEELASAYHRFYDACRVLPRSDEELGSVHIARLWVCAATQQTLANGLELLGVTAREKM
ncbi:MAG: arginine--tRNA ligase [Actinobacteria bacterium]|nr:arginine--tRNA ligase [Actinomycetota bacterium]MDA9227343.1 arginine--tRNA ligase [Actinomycetota bacterium]MDA9334205.1 arginine--tRNA ligase [Actinomycetota bacterium]